MKQNIKGEKMKIYIIKCPDCKVEIFSRANHDFKWCGCYTKDGSEGGFVDGGYMSEEGIWSPFRVGGTLMDGKSRVIELDVTEKELYDDWNYGTDKYGVIEK